MSEEEKETEWNRGQAELIKGRTIKALRPMVLEMTLNDMPVQVRAILAAAIVLFLIEFVVIGPLIFGLSWKVDPGLATLVGAVVGLWIVGQQARLGFKNLVASQENQARLDREAREHQLALEKSKEDGAKNYEKRLLMESIRAELVGLMDQASLAQSWASSLAIVFDTMSKQNVASSVKNVKFPGFRTPVFENSIDKLGLLGVSIAADVIIVCGRAYKEVDIKFDTPALLSLVAGSYRAHADDMHKWHGELHHVGMRLIAAEQGTADPGILITYRQKRDGQSTSGA